MTFDIFNLAWRANRAEIDKLKIRVDKLERGTIRSEIAGGAESLAFADKPAAGQAGRLLFITDARKNGEGVGNGTGTLCYDDGVAWRRVADDTTAAI